MPRLVKFYDKHQDKRNKFQILAFHDSTVQSFAELDERNANTLKTLWHGRQLPFPILIDSKRKTTTAWDITGFPTTIFINPEGKLVIGDLDMVEKALSE